MQLYLRDLADFHSAPEAIHSLYLGRNHAVSLQFTAVQQFKTNYLWWFTIDWNGKERKKRTDEWQKINGGLRKTGSSLGGVAPLGKKWLNSCCQRERDLRQLTYFLSACLTMYLTVSLSILLSVYLCLFACLSPISHICLKQERL